MKTIAFFNNKGGVGQTSLVYHLAWMYADLGVSVVAADFDPQANLTAMLLDERTLVSVLDAPASARKTIYGALVPVLEGAGDVADPHVEAIAPGLSLLIGDLALSSAEEEFSSQWPDCLDGRANAFRILSGLWRIVEKAVCKAEANLVLVDMGPNLGPLNRAALVAAESVVIPLAPDLYALQGLRTLGPTLQTWRAGWQERLQKAPRTFETLSLPSGNMKPAGYVVLQPAVRWDRPAYAYRRWIGSLPREYSEFVLNEPITGDPETDMEDEPYCLAAIKHYPSLMLLAQEAHKPIFHLRPADGAIGSDLSAVTNCYYDFRNLAKNVAGACSVDLPYWDIDI